MAMPPPLPPRKSGSGHGPFGAKAFNGALIGCGVLVVMGLPMVLASSGPVLSLGASFLAMGVLGLSVGGLGLLAERLLQRRPVPPNLPRRNGRRPGGPDPSRIKKEFREHP